MSHLPRINYLVKSQNINKLHFQPKKKSIDWISDTRKKLQMQNQVFQINHGQQQIKLSAKQLAYIERQSNKLKDTRLKLYKNYGVMDPQWSHQQIKLRYNHLLQKSRKLYDNELTQHNNVGHLTERLNNLNNLNNQSVQMTQNGDIRKEEKKKFQELVQCRNRKYLNEFKETRLNNMQSKRYLNNIQGMSKERYFGKLIPKLNFNKRNSSTLVYDRNQ